MQTEHKVLTLERIVKKVWKICVRIYVRQTNFISWWIWTKAQHVQLIKNIGRVCEIWKRNNSNAHKNHTQRGGSLVQTEKWQDKLNQMDKVSRQLDLLNEGWIV
jgi:hypothetical protein